jgi:surface carbohydrate biosynthesis protein
MNPGLLVIPCETQAREFDAKLLLACFAAERGHRVIIGSKKAINLRLGSLPRSIFLSKSLTKRNLLTYEVLERLGHAIVCGDEEGLVYASPESYLHSKVSSATLRKASALLAWGPENARIWRSYPGFHGAPIHSTGNPRVDLLRPELRPFFAPAVKLIRERFGPFVLVNTNFSRLNHYFPGQSRQRRKLEAAAAKGLQNGDLDVGLAAHKSLLFQHFLDMLPALARAFPDRTIVVRPHPSEKQETWLEAARGYANVRVVHEGNVAPWLLASEMLIHNGCTTAVEAYVAGTQAIAYQPVTSDHFDLQLPNLLSYRAYDLDELLALVDSHLHGSLPPTTETEEREKLIDRYVMSRSGKFASERVVDALASHPLGEKSPPLAPYLLARTAAGTRSLMQRCEAHLPGHHNNVKYLRHMFPGVTLPEVDSSIATFGGLLDRFGRVKARRLHENVFEITAA